MSAEKPHLDIVASENNRYGTFVLRDVPELRPQIWSGSTLTDRTNSYLADRFRRSPGTSPWYWRARTFWRDQPIARLDVSYDEGVLYRGRDAIIFSQFYDFILPFGDKCLVWTKTKGGNAFEFYVLDIETQDPLKFDWRTEPAGVRKVRPLYFEGMSIPAFSIRHDGDGLRIEGSIPQGLGDRILWVDNFEVFAGPGPGCAVFILDPMSGRITYQKLDFFNQGDFDFGYAWPTMAAEAGPSGDIFVCGIRIHTFVIEPDGKTKGILRGVT